MYIKNAQSVEPLHSEHGEIVHELIGNAAGGTATYSVAEIVIPPGKAALKHYHPVVEESYYILTGTGRMVMDDKTVTLKPGDALPILPNQVHQIFNDAETNLVLLAVCVPAWTPDNSVYLD
ncbi:MAG: cupin domain-containing protein [Anaerolineae bacterium]|nr:cupin domain-containing protein [Anaerolineae bacterium]